MEGNDISEVLSDLEEAVSGLSVDGDIEYMFEDHNDPSFPSINSSQLGGSQNSTSSQSHFKKHPELEMVFDRKRVLKGYEATCLFCKRKYMTTDYIRLLKHVSDCEKIDNQVRQCVKLKTKSPQIKDMIEPLILEFFVEHNVPFRAIESKSFKDLIVFLSPNHRKITRFRLADVIVPAASSKIEAEFIVKTKHSSFLAFEFDHWTDSLKRSVLGVAVTLEDGKRYLCDLHDVTSRGLSSVETIACLKESLGKLDPKRLNSIISDSAAAAKRTREQLIRESEYSHIIGHRCLAHFVNNLGNNFTTKCEPVASMISWASKMTNFITSSPVALDILRQQSKRRPVRPCSVRWYSTLEMLTTLAAARDCIRSGQVLGKRVQDFDANNDEKWRLLDRAIDILKPIVDVIVVAERCDGSLSEAVNAILELGCVLLQKSWEDDINLYAIKSYLKYMSPDHLDPDELSLWLASYMLDPRYHRKFLTDYAEVKVLGTILDVAIRSRHPAEYVQDHLRREFGDYCSLSREYGEQLDGKTTVAWWTERSACSTLRNVALRLAHLKSSSANIERVFSSLRLMEGLSRFNLSVDNLKHLGRIRVNQIESNKLQTYYGGSLSDPDAETVALEDEVSFGGNSQDFSDDITIDKTDLLDEQTAKYYRYFIALIDPKRIRPVNVGGNVDDNAAPEIDKVRIISDFIASRRNRTE